MEGKEDIVIKLPKQFVLASPRTVVCPGILSNDIPLTTVRKSMDKGKHTQGNIHSFGTKSSAFTTSSSLLEENTSTPDTMCIMYIQGVVEIQLSHIVITNQCSIIGKSSSEAGTALRISWTFFSFENMTTSSFKIDDGAADLGFSFFYKIDLNESFITYVVDNSLSIELIGSCLSENFVFAKGEVNLTQLLDEPNTKLQLVIDMLQEEKDKSETLPEICGTLYATIRLVCSENHVTLLRSRMAPASSHSRKDKKKSAGKTKSDFLKASLRNTRMDEDLFPSLNQSSDSESTSLSSETESDVEDFQEALDLVLTRNKALKITQSQIEAELKERSNWLHEEYNWKRTLQEYSILNGNDPHSIHWRQWRDANNFTVKLRRYSSIDSIYDSVVKIRICSLDFHYSMADWTKFPKIDMLFVECRFLLYNGQDMTTNSVKLNRYKVDTLKFDFYKLFDIDLKKNESVCKMLAQKIREKDTIKFYLFSEPFEDLSKCQCCFEVGFGEISLFDLVQLFENFIAQTIDIEQVRTKDIIGRLTLSIEGIQAMRSLAIQMLSPPDLLTKKSEHNS